MSRGNGKGERERGRQRKIGGREGGTETGVEFGALQLKRYNPDQATLSDRSSRNNTHMSHPPLLNTCCAHQGGNDIGTSLRGLVKGTHLKHAGVRRVSIPLGFVVSQEAAKSHHILDCLIGQNLTTFLYISPYKIPLRCYLSHLTTYHHHIVILFHRVKPYQTKSQHVGIALADKIPPHFKLSHQADVQQAKAQDIVLSSTRENPITL